jgi:hypothetical protein
MRAAGIEHCYLLEKGQAFFSEQRVRASHRTISALGRECYARVHKKSVSEVTMSVCNGSQMGEVQRLTLVYTSVDEAGEIKTQQQINEILTDGQLLLFDQEPLTTLSEKIGLSRKRYPFPGERA